MANKTFSKIFAFLLALMLIVSSAVVAGAEPFYSGWTDDGFYYTEDNGICTLVSYAGTAENLVLTEEGCGYDFDYISDGAFKGVQRLKSVTIGENIDRIGDNAFEDCIYLEEITFLGDRTRVGKNAFLNTAYYNNLDNWQDGVLYIDNCLIKADPEKASGEITVKDGTTVVASGAFNNCNNVESIELCQGVKALCAEAITFNTSLKGVVSCGDIDFFGYRAVYGNHTDFFMFGNSLSVQEYCDYNGVRYYSLNNVTRNYSDIGIEVTMSEFLAVQLGHYYDGIDNYEVKFLYRNDYPSNLPTEAQIKIAFDRRVNYLEVYNLKTGAAINTEAEFSDGFVTFGVNESVTFVIGTYNYISTVDEATGIKLEIPAEHMFEVQDFYRGDEGIKFDAVDEYTPDGYETVTVYVMAVALDGEPLTDHKRVGLAIPVENENYAVFNVSLDYEVTNANAEYKDGYLVFDSYDFEQGVALFFLSEKESVPATDDEASTKDEATTNDEATFDESTADEGTKDEATLDEATKDESTIDESTKDEEPSNPSDSTKDESDFMLGDVNRDGKLNIRDATLIQKYIAKISELDDEQIMLADFNEDGKVNVKDATRIQKKIANLI